MMHPQKVHRVLIGIFLGCTIAGCAWTSTPIYEPGLVTTWDKKAPLPTTTAPPISVVLHVRSTLYDDRPGGLWYSHHVLDPAIQGALKRAKPHFPCLASAQVGKRDVPYTLVISATHATRASVVEANLSGLTLFLFPLHERLILDLEAKLLRGSTVIKMYRATRTMDVTYDLLFVLTPWKWFTHEPTFDNTFCDLFLQIQHDAPQLFDTSSPKP